MGDTPAAEAVLFTALEGLPGVEIVRAYYPKRAFPTHTHREYVVGAITSGAEILEVGQQRYVAAAGTSLLLHPNQAHANTSIPPTPLSYRVFYIPPETIDDWLQGQLGFSAPINTCQALHDTICKTHLALQNANDRLEQQLAFAKLIEALQRISQVRRPEDQTPSKSADVDLAKDYIEANFREDFGLEQLCAIAGLNRFQLIRAFKKTTGLSPLAYRNQRRIDEARRLLRGDETITQIAMTLGYADHAHMTRHFQRIVGTSPSRYRAQ